MYTSLFKFKKNYNILYEQSKSVTQRTDNTIAKQKRIKLKDKNDSQRNYKENKRSSNINPTKNRR